MYKCCRSRRSPRALASLSHEGSPSSSGRLTGTHAALLSGRPQGRQQPRQAPGGGGGWRRSRRSRKAPLFAGIAPDPEPRPLVGLGSLLRAQADSAFPLSSREVAGGAASNRDPTIPVLLSSYEVRTFHRFIQTNHP
ncbi:uncharacterized protein ACIQIH_010746 isoform 2-T3 [Cyanocitta cristata]